MSFQTKIAGLLETLQFENWQQIIFDRIVCGATTAIYKYKGMELIVDHSRGDANGLRSILTSDMYRMWIRRMVLPRRAVILDLGANCGAFPVLVRSMGFEIERAVCVELNPQTFARLEFNLRRNFHQGSMRCLNAAVTTKKGEISLRFGPGSTSDSTHNCAIAGDSGPSVSVLTMSFDDVVSNELPDTTIDICKIDVEGAEYEVFLDGQVVTLKQVRYLVMEFHPAGDRPGGVEQLVALLATHGFREIGRDGVVTDCFVALFENQKLVSEFASR